MSVFETAATDVLELARDGRPRPAIDLVLGLLARGATVEQLITQVLRPVQQQVGARWQRNEWDVADEHAATAVVDGVLGAIALQTPLAPPTGAVALVACAEGEHHTLPARMGAELLRGEGWDVTFLGGSLPADDLQRYAGVTEPDVVVISCTVPLFLSGARRCFAAITELGLPVMAAGAAFGDDGSRARRLGASGRIGPALHPDAVLHDRDARGSDAASPPAEADRIEQAAPDLEDECMAALTDRMPQLSQYSDAQLASTRTDVGYIISYLSTAIDVADDEIFLAFVAWLRQVLDTRGVPPVVLDRSLHVISQVMSDAGMADAARLCASPLVSPV